MSVRASDSRTRKEQFFKSLPGSCTPACP